MSKTVEQLGFDADGIKRVMRARDYISDGAGQFGTAIIANLVGQLTYFYTDKVGLSVMGVGVILAIAKVADAVANLFIGNFIDHSKGGSRKYYRWVIRMIVPAMALIVMMFTVPKGVEILSLAYALIVNILLTAFVYCLIATPLGAIMVVRVRSQAERGTMGVIRAVGNYLAGMFISIVTIPVTNLLGGTQIAWIKYGVILALLCGVTLLICWLNGRKAVYAGDFDDEQVKQATEIAQDDDTPLFDAVRMLFGNRYWVTVLLFNIIAGIMFAIAAAGGPYYAKWIFGNDNLVSIVGMGGMVATLIGFLITKPMLSKFGIRNTLMISIVVSAAFSLVRVFIPTVFPVFVATSIVGSLAQIPMIALFGVLTSMTVDYNEYKYGTSLVGVSSGAIGLGNAFGGGVGALILSIFLSVGHYDPTLSEATTSMRWSIYGFSNYLPLVLSIILALLFVKFDLESRMPEIHAEIERKRAERAATK